MDKQQKISKAIHHEKGDLQTQAILQTAMDGFWIVDLKGKFIDVNEVACKMVGYTRTEMLKLSIFDLERVETAEQTKKHIQKVFENGEDRFQTKHRCKNGETIDVELSVKIQLDQNLILVFVRDITERVQNEKRITDLVERLTLSQEASSAGSWDWDIQNNIFYWSKEFLNLFGMEPDTVPGFESWTRSLYPDDIELASKRIKDAIDNKTDLLQDYRIVLPDGTMRWIRATGKVTCQNDIPIRMIGLCIDFSEEKRAEEALSESEKKFRSLFESMSEGIVYEDHDGNIISANPAAERLLGLSLDQLQGRTSLDPRWKAIHEDGSPFPGEYHSLHVAAKTGKPSTDEIMGIYNPKMDSYIWLSVNSTPEFVPGKKIPFRAFAVFRDVTERKKSDEALKSSEERYRMLFQNLNAGYALHEIILNAEGKPCDYRFLEINPAFERLTSLNAADIIGKKAMEILPNSESYWVDTYGDVALKGKIVNFENYSQVLNKHYQVSAYSPEPGKFATVFLDITERKQAEEALQKSEAQLRLILDATPFPIAIVDTEDNKINFWSRSAFDVFGHTAPTTSKWYELAYPDPDYRREVVGRWKPFLEKARSSRQATNTGEYQVTCRDGSVVTCELYATFLADLLIVTFNNITLRKRAEVNALDSQHKLSEALEVSNRSRKTLLSVLEDQRRAQQEIIKLNTELEHRVIERTAQLEAANKELEAFSYSVSHDLRAPLRHISGFADMLSRDAQEQLPEKSQHYLDVINNSAKKMGTLIDDLLSFSRTGRAEIKKTNFTMNQVLDDALLQVKNSTVNRRISWNITNLPEVFGDYNLVRQVWINLLDNAIKYTGTRKNALIHIDCTEEKEEYIFSIRDNGVGFDMKYANKLFGVFQRLHSIEEFEGTGIGLANVRRIISRHGGRTWADAKLDLGATFYFSLPR
jgi:PAS domain S-box-containing protein